MKLTIKILKEKPVGYVELDDCEVTDQYGVISNYYQIKRIKEKSLRELKARLHEMADSLTEDDLELT